MRGKMQSVADPDGGKIALMNSPRHIHLRLHSEYSVTDGIVRVGDAIKRAAGDGMPALALTDLGNLFGLVKFYTGARGKGVSRLPGRMSGSPIRNHLRIPAVYCCWCATGTATGSCANC